MKKLRRSAIAACALSTSAAFAQSSVTLYGRIDASINSLHFSGPNRASVRTVSSDSSHWGMRGTEDLGAGLRALFKMESQFQVDSGAQGNKEFYFNRDSYAGLQSDRFGTLTLGSHLTPHVRLTFKVSPFERAQLGNVVALFQGGPRGYQVVQNNSAAYTSPRWRGFMLRAMLGLSEGAALSKTRSLGLEYEAGPWWLGMTHDALKVSAASVGLPATQPSLWSRTTVLGASYDFKVVRIMAYYQTNHAQRLTDIDGWMVGAVAPVATGEVRMGYSRNNITATTRATQLTLGYSHFLSKRTLLYTNVSKIWNDGSRIVFLPARQDIGASGFPIAGQDVRGFQIGMRHLF
jgi:general bacterial porin, GBP family